jgi:DNA repair protein RecO (recombination protein O)
MATFRDEGIVLRTMRLGEADRIVTFLTPEHGKIRAVGKGVRKTKSKLGGRLDLMTHVSLLCWRGRELDVITQAEVVNLFRPIREDLEKMPVAFVMLEAVDQVAVERHPLPELFAMVTGALETLAKAGTDGNGPGAVLLGAFLWKLLALEGVGPVVEACASCGDEAPLVAFDEGVGGFLCRNCRSGQAVSPEAVGLVRLILGGQLRRALDEPPSRVTAEVERLATVATEYHLDRRLRSAHLAPGPPALPSRSRADG